MAQPPAEKLHTACDECRTRKLRCEGSRPACARCARDGGVCVYSPQKAMGRPRKRRRGSVEGGDGGVREEGVGVANEGLGGFAVQRGGGLVSPAPEEGEGGVVAGGGGYVQDQDPGLVGVYDDIDFGLTPPLDPSLWTTDFPLSTPVPTDYPLSTPLTALTPADQSPLPPCPCLSLTYLTLTKLHTIPLSFPLVLAPLRDAMTTITTLTACPTCPLDAFSAGQNISALVSLFRALLSRISAALAETDREAARLAAAGATKLFRVGDASAALAHLHTGTRACPMGVDVALRAEEWRVVVKAALRGLVEGGGTTVGALLEEAEARQQRWHADEGFMERAWGAKGRCEGPRHGACETLNAAHIRRFVGMLDWD
ncbi:hypothetical protein C7974DRAFT_443035 [Boeremia exigua]|uniref:uncharacterized protein n=1 Tax=Boeremia exigua TaxID=749465 RepID=UPI001E8EDEC7|nr:uncharacterized protein C7974DRAFT_443035 [Boeremia exigua]KAH6614984.1 hypothetical protein C7974DRAFT_443035 [Boeremia exigua]